MNDDTFLATKLREAPQKVSGVAWGGVGWGAMGGLFSTREKKKVKKYKSTDKLMFFSLGILNRSSA